MKRMAADTLKMHGMAYNENVIAENTAESRSVPHPGDYSYRSGNDSEKHMNDPLAIAKLQEATSNNNR